MRQAAPSAGISEGRWRQLELRYQQFGDGQRVAAKPKSSTAIAMADAVGLDLADAFEALGQALPAEVARRRGEARLEKAEYLRRQEEGASGTLADVSLDELLAEIARRARANNPDADR